MFRNILVAVDGTAFGEAAVPWALAAAGKKAAVHLVHAHCFPPPRSGVVCDPNLDQTLLTQEGQYLAGLTSRIRAAAPGLAITARKRGCLPIPAEALGSLVRTVGTDLVIMATHGRGLLARFIHGSVADQFVRLSPVPVLIVRSEEASDEMDLHVKPRLERLVLPLDGSVFAEQVLEPAMSLGSQFGTRFTLLCVVDEGAGLSAEHAAAYLDRVARTVLRGAVCKCEVVRDGSAAEAVLAAAGSEPGTGIALAIHGREGFSRMLYGSVADEVIRRFAGTGTGPSLFRMTCCSSLARPI